MIKKIAKQVLPPIMAKVIRKTIIKKSIAGWNVIEGGNLKNREIFVDGTIHKEFVEGSYDQFFSDYLSKLDLKGKVIFEVGAHIGYHAMQFAQLVGESGTVHAFEPNVFNRERLQLNLSKNPDLAKVIKVHDVAVSDGEGQIEFNFSSNVDDGQSSGSFICGAHTPYQDDFYDSIGFKKVIVKTIALDHVSDLIRMEEVPYLIKIDVEGAENFVLQGAINTIEKFKPIILMEIHSIYNMFNICEFFHAKNYKIELLKEEANGLCFVVATPIN